MIIAKERESEGQQGWQILPDNNQIPQRSWIQLQLRRRWLRIANGWESNGQQKGGESFLTTTKSADLAGLVAKYMMMMMMMIIIESWDESWVIMSHEDCDREGVQGSAKGWLTIKSAKPGRPGS